MSEANRSKDVSRLKRAFHAIEKLQAYAKQLKLWAEIAKQGVEKGENLDAISRRILESDAAVQKAVEYIESHPIFSTTVLDQSVKGVMKSVGKIRNL